MPCARHVGIGTGGPEGAAVFRAEEPVQNADEHRKKQHRQQQRVLQTQLPHVPLGNQQVVFVNADGGVGLAAHDPQIDGVQRQLGQNARKDCRNAAAGVQQSRDQPRCQSGGKGTQQGQPGIDSQPHEHHAHGAAGGKTSVHCQVRHVQNPVGQIDSDGHYAPQESLGHGAGERIQKRQEKIHGCYLIFPDSPKRLPFHGEPFGSLRNRCFQLRGE